MYYPLNYDQITWAEGHNSPSAVRARGNWSYNYWMRSLYFRLCSRFDFKLPETWQGNVKNFFNYWLWRLGYLMISKDEELGYFFQPCGLSGFDFYYQPVTAIVANPRMSREFTIGEDCELLQVTPDYLGYFDILDRYAIQLSELDVAINTNMINSKMAYILSAKTKAEAEALKVIVDRINRGEPAVFYDRTLGERKKPTDEAEPFFVTQIQEVAKNYIVSAQLKDHQTILNAFDAEIGIQTVPYQKMERMVVDEAEARKEDSQARILTCADCLDTSLRRIRELYPDLEISYSIRADGSGEEASDDGDR